MKKYMCIWCWCGCDSIFRLRMKKAIGSWLTKRRTEGWPTFCTRQMSSFITSPSWYSNTSWISARSSRRKRRRSPRYAYNQVYSSECCISQRFQNFYDFLLEVICPQFLPHPWPFKIMKTKGKLLCLCLTFRQLILVSFKAYWMLMEILRGLKWVLFTLGYCTSGDYFRSSLRALFFFPVLFHFHSSMYRSILHCSKTPWYWHCWNQPPKYSSTHPFVGVQLPEIFISCGFCLK